MNTLLYIALGIGVVTLWLQMGFLAVVITGTMEKRGFRQSGENVLIPMGPIALLVVFIVAIFFFAARREDSPLSKMTEKAKAIGRQI